MADFVEKEEEENYEEDYADEFDESYNLKNVINSSKKPDNQKKETKETAAIKIDIDSVEKLISNLSFSAQEIKKALEGVEKNKDLNKILDQLSTFKTLDFQKFSTEIEKIVSNFDTSKIEKKIDQKFEKSFEKSFEKIEIAAKKFEKYGATFADTESIDVFDRIENMENFLTKKFKFRSIIFASILSAFIAFASSFYIFKSLESPSSNQELTNFFSHVSYRFAQNSKVKQLWILKNQPSVQEILSDKLYIFQIQK